MTGDDLGEKKSMFASENRLPIQLQEHLPPPTEREGGRENLFEALKKYIGTA